MISWRKFSAFALLCFLGLSVSAKPGRKDESYMARIEKQKTSMMSGKLLNNYLSVNWINSRQFWYSAQFRREDGTIGTKYFLCDAATSKKSLIFDNIQIRDKINAISPEESRIDSIGYLHFDFNSGTTEEAFFSIGGGRNYVYDLKTGSVSATSRLPRKNSFISHDGRWWRSYSADSLYFVYSCNDEICLGRTGTDDTTKLSSGSQQFHSFSTSGYRQTPARGRSAVKGNWIGNSHHFLAFRRDMRNVGTLSLVNNLAKGRPSTVTYKFPMPADRDVTQYEVFLVDAENDTIYPIDIAKYKDQKIITPYFVPCQNNDESAWFLRLSRTCDSLDLCRLDARTRQVVTVISEVCKPHLNEQLFDYHILNKGKEILWWSERTGKGQWYLYSGDGTLKNVIGRGDYVSGRIERIDTAGRYIIYEGYGREKDVNPDYKLYYRASLDGRGQATLLTPDNGEHRISFSPGGRYIFDSWSRMDMPPHNRVMNLSGKVCMELEGCDASALEKNGWKAPKVMEFTAADSVTKLYGVVYMPFKIEKGRKYPIITNVYPGPHIDLVPRNFVLDDNDNQSLAQLGFIVVNVSYRGSCPLRGRDFYNHGYGNLRDYALDDDYAVIRQVAERFPFADINRVGIYGHSGGGFMTVAAMLTRPDFYKVGIAASGNHDNNIYSQWWGETFHGGHWGEDGRFICDIPTNAELADNLQGKLLLITGDMDNNVHPASTMKLAAALINSGKRFDMLVIPGADHGLGDTYYTNLIQYYFVENLLGIKLKDIDIIRHN